MITLDTPVEDLLTLPGIIAWFIERRVSPFSCFGAFPSSLGRLLELQGVADPEALLRELKGAFRFPPPGDQGSPFDLS